MKTVIILLAFLLTVSGQRIEEIQKFVQDLIQNEKVPSVLSVIACWSQSDNFYFAKSSNIPVQITNHFKIANRTTNDSTNKLWHFIDMRCKGSYDFLYKIERQYFAHPYRWIMFEVAENQLANSTFLTDSNVIFVNVNENLNRFDLKQGNLFEIINKKN